VKLDIVIPVYNEGANIVPVLEAFRKELHLPYRVLICYDFDEDTTLAALAPLPKEQYRYELVKNKGRGVMEAIRAGLEQTTAEYVITFPADDDFNAPRVPAMIAKADEGYDIVSGSRFIPGGCMTNCPWLKAVLVRTSSFFLYHVCRVPSHDATNGLRLFSRRVIDEITIESKVGFAYSVELLVKCHRLGWPIGEVPFQWFERKAGKSRFQVLNWVPAYMHWVFYAMATTWLRRESSAPATPEGTPASKKI
jgi:glycosyltransferase involved in cell wall biosynthesis